MNAIATRFQVTAAALAVAATAVIAPIAANAAPSVQIPAAPINAVMDNVAQAPGDFLFLIEVRSLQTYSNLLAARSNALDLRASRLEAYAAANPGTFFGAAAARTAARVTANRDKLGDVSVSICHGGVGYSVGPYGALTSGPC